VSKVAQASYPAPTVQIRFPHQGRNAVRSTTQIAFKNRHPLVDIGAITRPGIIPYLNDPRQTLSWAKENGERYFHRRSASRAGRGGAGIRNDRAVFRVDAQPFALSDE
jgi:hypothetical protein